MPWLPLLPAPGEGWGGGTAPLIHAAALVLALLIDRVLGEPPARWHPVVWMGRYLGRAGPWIAPRNEVAPPARSGPFAAGALAWCAGGATVVLAAVALSAAATRLPPWVAALLLGLALKPLLAWRMLRDEVLAVEAALACSLAEGRARLTHLVSRDVRTLDEGAVRESAIESLAENLNDSVVAPVFWFLVAGLPGAVIYRFANTADAMWGYRGFRAGSHWEWAGKWAARADDVLSWLPARITALLIAALSGRWAWHRVRGEARRTASPNSGWPMAAMALALGARLRKPGVYALNETAPSPSSADTARALRLSDHAVAVLLAWVCLAIFALAEVR